ncbi:hypothetical protein COLO4_35935 [Corchorus olitorius]|uniref:DUF4283 domain-containing protein n=1 Tax=Corchorus olitorius TaxID=93759 RepID=A0A1R3GBS5_9ROSI|nr:hypothetical protein COLO4_35935 [Corchorus olitorius]
MTEPNQININFLRECSWTDSDSPTEESEEEVESDLQCIHPRPAPPFRSRLSHRVRLGTGDVMESREETNKCIVGFLLDMRRFSTETIQRWVQQEWKPTGEVTVIGRDDNRYLIFFSDDTDRRVALEQTPWSYQGALFATRRWNPNVPLGEIVLDRIELWLQIWGLSVEYQNAVVAEKLARTAGEVIRIDWRNQRPRNIRFLRVRIALDPRQPLAAGCTLEKDDGTVQWVPFSYEKINKLCLSCGMLGHTHPYCSRDAAEVDRLARQRMRPITERRNRDNQPPFLNIERSVHYERGSSSGAAYQSPVPMQEEKINGLQAIQEEEQVTQMQEMTLEAGGQETDERVVAVTTIGEDVQVQLQSLMLREGSNEEPQGPEPTHITEISDPLETIPLERGLDDNIADTLQSLQSLHHLVQPHPPPQPSHNVTVEAEMPAFEYPPLEPLLDPLSEFDISTARLEQLEQRHDRGLHNMADLEDIQIALGREHARFEHICEEIVRQSAEMLEGLQNRHLNDPMVQPNDNNVRWISLPQGGAVYTNARLQVDIGTNNAKSSRMGAQNKNQPNLRNMENLEFELNLQMEQQQLRMVESQITLNPTATEHHPPIDQCTSLEEHPPTLLLGFGKMINPTSPGFICTVNEEDMASAFLNDTPSPDIGPQEAAEDEQVRLTRGREKEAARKSPKRRRSVEESSDLDSEERRRVRQRLEGFEMKAFEASDKENTTAEGSRPAVPQ